ncbi:probably inactive leucine-rich repeat receptor-like protein kinase At5g48380 isoform X1 [Ricinus communis]|uniref:probably inactive leucine-rich repeat receptor-like protein kinase At5g48380 isoform X1 n=1 Tax=Ricinus communis TaxID=3988 RepID=UPI00201AB90B|nr:probably inactive leucine-rich repeat receptor-like protein kinase At5g48380 isoform X1 [Ricinus communis]
MSKLCKQIQMAQKRIVDAILLPIFIWLLLGSFATTIGTATDIVCLKSIKHSLEDPFDYLKSSWDFSNNTEGFICEFTGVDCWHADENKVLNLRLSGMGLKGQFPSGIENCTSLTGLDLSNNELQGPIPFNISKLLPYITSLDLSSNNFSGEIPTDIANCSHLNVLKLDHNRLASQIPPAIGFLDRIKVFSVANNLLSGPVPDFQNATFPADSYANNILLCGGPLEKCKDHSRKFHWRFDYSFRSGFEIGYAVSAISAVVVYASYCVPWVYMGKKNGLITIPAMVMLMMRKKNKKVEFDQLGSLSTVEFLLEKEVSTSENFVTRMSFKDLRDATDNFSQDNVIWSGEMGTMYKAPLANGWSLAVKKFFNSQQSEERFITELKILGRLRHDNLIPIIGFCNESKKRLLVYKYISKGNLFYWLHSREDKKRILEWPLRMKIAAGLARGLAWLHHCCEFRVAHLNISSKNVLLDQNFEAKLSNFGMATMINPKEINASTGFCMDTEFWEECFLKEDVFNFGLVLLELITGRNITSSTGSNGSLGKSISDFASRSSCMYDAIDELLIGQGHDGEISEFLRVACNCVQPFPEQRPSMLYVYTTISIIQARHGN